MNLIINDLLIPFEDDGIDAYVNTISQRLEIGVEDITIFKILSKSLDLSNKEQFYYKLTLVVSVHDSFENRHNIPLYHEPVIEEKKIINTKERPIIVGFGPAGMFAAIELLDCGVRPIIFERGKQIEERSLDISRFMTERVLHPESNIQFGEGGAGAYSDGKLFSRRNNNTSYVNRVLKTFVRFGAPCEIEYMGKPHLGTDVLCRIVSNIRLHILERGGEIYYNSKMTDLLISKGNATGIVINNEKEYISSRIFIALGHSARDTFEMLHKKGVAMEQRPISVGVRIEHPAQTINLMRYGEKYFNYNTLGAATYSLNYTNRNNRRGVYTFCMCPGGEVVNASSEPGMMVLNGMSYSHRSSAFSNAALVVTVKRDDYKSANPLAGIKFQRDIEQKAFIAGGENWHVPAQNLMDFLGIKHSAILNKNSCKTGTIPCDLKEILPGFVITELVAAFNKWKEEVPLFITGQAILMAPETRTSSPVKIIRNNNFESVNIRNIIPIGEGSGYTGGITSSAADAIKAVSRGY